MTIVLREEYARDDPYILVKNPLKTMRQNASSLLEGFSITHQQFNFLKFFNQELVALEGTFTTYFFKTCSIVVSTKGIRSLSNVSEEDSPIVVKLREEHLLTLRYDFNVKFDDYKTIKPLLKTTAIRRFLNDTYITVARVHATDKTFIVYQSVRKQSAYALLKKYQDLKALDVLDDNDVIITNVPLRSLIINNLA